MQNSASVGKYSLCFHEPRATEGVLPITFKSLFMVNWRSCYCRWKIRLQIPSTESSLHARQLCFPSNEAEITA